MGKLAFSIAWKPRTIAIRNLQQCFPEQETAWHQQMAKAYFANLGVGVMEFVQALWWCDDKLRPLLRFHGFEHIDAAVANGHGVILLTGHFTSIEMSIRLANLTHYPFASVYRDLKNPWLNELIYRNRHRSAGQMIERQQTRRLLRVLKQGAVMFYLPDMDMGKRFESMFVPLFGIPAATITATSKLAKAANAVVLPVTYYRLPDDSGYHIDVNPALENFPTDDVVADTARVNACLEAIIRQTPAQYFWHQKRFRRS